MKDKLLNYLKNFMLGNDFEYENTLKVCRAIFTTVCFVENIDADTSECDNILSSLYYEANMDAVMDYDEFENYMVELIV